MKPDKAVIDGIRYDTSKANKIACFTTRLAPSDLRYFSEALYKTANGRFFLSGTGGPLTHYAEKEGNTTWGSDRITPMSPDAARAWLEKYKFIQALEQEFGGQLQDA